MPKFQMARTNPHPKRLFPLAPFVRFVHIHSINTAQRWFAKVRKRGVVNRTRGEIEVGSSELLAIMWPNETKLDIQTRDRLCEYKWTHSPPADEELSDEFKEFRDKLNGIHGVDKVDIGRHEVCIGRYDIFTWEELVTQIAAVMTAFTGSEYTVRWDDRRNMYEDQKPFDSDG